jgi:hypothetical protein
VDVIGPVIVAALVSGNDSVGVIDAVDEEANGGWAKPKDRKRLGDRVRFAYGRLAPLDP